MEPKIILYPSGYATDFHLSGQHDQSTHGRRGNSVGLRPVDKQGEALSRSFHEDATDKQGKDYVKGHLTQVGTTLPEDLALAGWLHDAIEDTGTSPDQLAKSGVDAETIRIVKAVTTDGPNAHPRFKAIQKDMPKKLDLVIELGGPKAARVKLSDMSSNSDPTRNPGKPPKQKYLDGIKQLSDYLEKTDPALYQDFQDRVVNKPGSFDWSKVPVTGPATDHAGIPRRLYPKPVITDEE